MDTTKENKVVPKLRFKEFKDSWSLKTLNDLTKLITKGTTPKSFTLEGINFVKIEGLVGTHINREKCLHIDEETHLSSLRRSILKNNDIIFAIAGATIGKVGIVTDDILPANTNQALSIIRLANIDNLSFILQILQSSLMKKYIYKNISVGAQPNLSLKQVNDFSFFIPTLNEQKKTASFLSAVDEKIQQLIKKKELLEDYKKGIIQKIFSQEIRFKDDNGNNYSDWKEKKLSEVLHEHKLKCSGKEEVFSVSVHKGLINQVEHLGRSFSAKNTDNYNLVKPNDIVYTKSPTGEFPYGIIKQAKIKKDVIVSPLYAIFTPESKHLGYILDAYFESKHNTHNYLHSIIQKGAKNTINITNSTFVSKSLKLPDNFDEQKKVGEFLSEIDKKIKLVNNQLEKTKEFKKGLLQQMFV